MRRGSKLQPKVNHESRRIRTLHLHPRWAGQTASPSRKVHVGRIRFAFSFRRSNRRRVGDARPLDAGVVRARGLFDFRAPGQHHAYSARSEFLRGLQGDPGPKFPILLKKVVYDGTHTGDWLPVKESPALLRELNLVLGSSDILTEGEKEFFQAMKRMCEASIATGNPSMF